MTAWEHVAWAFALMLLSVSVGHVSTWAKKHRSARAAGMWEAFAWALMLVATGYGLKAISIAY
jgi:hypothetical protein